MSSLLEGEERVEQELTGEPLAAPATGSVVLHGALTLAIVLYYVLGGFHSSLWGGAVAGGAIRVNIVSSAIPLPSDQPPNQNVLATDKPSPAPVLPLPKPAAPVVEEKAIPIQGKQEKPKPKPAPKTPPKQQPPPKQENRAQYGEQAGSSIPRAIQGQTTVTGPVTVNEGDFGTRFAYYIAAIQRKMASNWNKLEVDPRTPKGTRTFIMFTIHRDGTISNVQQERSSGSPTLDRSCLRAAQRVDTFGPLPAQYSPSTVLTSYYCEY